MFLKNWLLSLARILHRPNERWVCCKIDFKLDKLSVTYDAIINVTIFVDDSSLEDWDYACSIEFTILGDVVLLLLKNDDQDTLYIAVTTEDLIEVNEVWTFNGFRTCLKLAPYWICINWSIQRVRHKPCVAFKEFFTHSSCWLDSKHIDAKEQHDRETKCHELKPVFQVPEVLILPHMMQQESKYEEWNHQSKNWKEISQPIIDLVVICKIISNCFKLVL